MESMTVVVVEADSFVRHELAVLSFVKDLLDKADEKTPMVFLDDRVDLECYPIRREVPAISHYDVAHWVRGYTENVPDWDIPKIQKDCKAICSEKRAVAVISLGEFDEVSLKSLLRLMRKTFAYQMAWPRALVFIVQDVHSVRGMSEISHLFFIHEEYRGRAEAKRRVLRMKRQVLVQRYVPRRVIEWAGKVKSKFYKKNQF